MPTREEIEQQIKDKLILDKIDNMQEKVDDLLNTINNALAMYNRRIDGQQAIADFFGKSKRSFWQNHKQELLEAGFVHRINKKRPGQPNRIEWFAFELRLMTWAALKSQKGEVI